MPIDSSAPSAGHARRRASRSSRRPRNVGARPRPTWPARPTVIRPCDVEARRGRASGRQRRRHGGRREARLGRIEVDVHLEQDRIARSRPNLAGQPVEPRRRARRNRRSGSTRRLDRLARLVRLERPERCQRAPGTSGVLASASWTRFSPSSPRPAATACAQALGRHGLGDRDERRPCPGRGRPRAHRDRRASGARTRRRSQPPRSASASAIAAAAHRCDPPAAPPAAVTCCGAGSSGSRDRRRRTRSVGLTGTGSPTLRSAARTRPSPHRRRGGLAHGVAVGRLLALPLELLEEVALARRADRRPAVHRRRLASRWVGVATLAAVEAGRDDRDHDLVAEPLVEARAEDDVGLRVGGLLDRLGGLLDLEQRQGRRAGDVPQDALGAVRCRARGAGWRWPGWAASTARFSPLARPMPMSAEPASFMIARTSAKSWLMRPGT